MYAVSGRVCRPEFHRNRGRGMGGIRCWPNRFMSLVAGLYYCETVSLYGLLLVCTVGKL